MNFDKILKLCEKSYTNATCTDLIPLNVKYVPQRAGTLVY